MVPWWLPVVETEKTPMPSGPALHRLVFFASGRVRRPRTRRQLWDTPPAPDRPRPEESPIQPQRPISST